MLSLTYQLSHFNLGLQPFCPQQVDPTPDPVKTLPREPCSTAQDIPQLTTPVQGTHNVVFQKISILSPQKVHWFQTLHPSGKATLPLYFPVIVLSFENPLSLEISNDLPLGCVAIFSGTMQS